MKTVMFGGIFNVKVWIEILGCFGGTVRLPVVMKYWCNVLGLSSMRVQKFISWCGGVGLIFGSSIL